MKKDDNENEKDEKLTSVYLPSDLMTKIKMRAITEGSSMKEIMIKALKKYLEGDK